MTYNYGFITDFFSEEVYMVIVLRFWYIEIYDVLKYMNI